MSLAFDRSEFFAVDKASGETCRYLDVDHGCSIHGALEERGFSGCARYDCLGAGQRVVEELFDGRSWRGDPTLAAAMFDAFRAMREVHELLSLLRTARRLRLKDDRAARLREFEDALNPENGWTSSALRAFERGTLSEEIRKFLGSLRTELASVRRLPLLA